MYYLNIQWARFIFHCTVQKGHLLKTEMHERKNDYIFCFTAELPQNKAKDLNTMHYGTGYALWDRISQTELCSVIFAHSIM